MNDLFTAADERERQRYPHQPGAKRPGTSQDAADAMTGRAPLLRDRCLAALRNSDGLTADEVAGDLRESVLAVRPRFSELSQLGQIEDTGERRPNASGKLAIVWRARG